MLRKHSVKQAQDACPFCSTGYAVKKRLSDNRTVKRIAFDSLPDTRQSLSNARKKRLFDFLYFFYKKRYYSHTVAYDTDIRNVEYGSVLILVDSYDIIRT